MKIGIIGAGVSGLSMARLLEKYDVEVFEKNSFPGGIARTKSVNGLTYHLTGGHCFNSKFQDVLEFVFQKVLPLNEWNLIARDAVIRFKDHEVSYPIEYAVNQIFNFDPQLAINITRDLLNTEDTGEYSHLEDWFRKKFGNTLTDEYFLPYNKKIWNKDPSEMDPSWVEGKLPVPNKISFFNSLINVQKDTMPHSYFYYPKSNDQNTFLDALSRGVKISYNYSVNSLKYDSNLRMWCINGERYFHHIISTIPLNVLPRLIDGCPENVLSAGQRLKFNKVSTMLWETKETQRTWTYIPDETNFFHRYIHIGNFFSPQKNISITEAIGEKSYEEMLENGRKDPFLLTPLDYNVSEHAYVVFDSEYKNSTQVVRDYLNEVNLFTLGRFGEWEYYNMDVCIKSAMDLFKLLIKKFDNE